RSARDDEARRHRAGLNRIDRADARILKQRWITAPEIRLAQRLGRFGCQLHQSREIEGAIDQDGGLEAGASTCKRGQGRCVDISPGASTAHTSTWRNSPVTRGIVSRALGGKYEITNPGWERVRGRQPIVGCNREIATFGELFD